MRSLQGFRQVLEFLGGAELTRRDVDLARHQGALEGVVQGMVALAARREGPWGDSRALTSQRKVLRRKVEWEFLSVARPTHPAGVGWKGQLLLRGKGQPGGRMSLE